MSGKSEQASQSSCVLSFDRPSWGRMQTNCLTMNNTLMEDNGKNWNASYVRGRFQDKMSLKQRQVMFKIVIHCLIRSLKTRPKTKESAQQGISFWLKWW